MDAKKKKNNIILISTLSVICVALIACLVVKYVVHKEEPAMWEYYDPLLPQKEVIYRNADTMLELQKGLFTGKKFIATNNDNNNVIDFEFRDDGTFKGYTKAEYDDLGSWNVTSENDKTYLVINTINVEEKYLVGYNNNKDITLENDEGRIYVLDEKE